MRGRAHAVLQRACHARYHIDETRDAQNASREQIQAIIRQEAIPPCEMRAIIADDLDRDRADHRCTDLAPSPTRRRLAADT
jgi:hypothetical protein